MVGYRSARLYIIIAIGLLFSAFLLYVPRTDIPSRSKQYVNDILVNTGFKEKPKPDHGTGVDQFDFNKFFFQADLEWYDLAYLDVEKLKDYPPLHYRGEGRPTFATFYASRNATMYDPYFFAAQQIVYRLLWDPRSRTTQYPVTIFVAPFISQEQRDYFSAAGAVVKELPLRLFQPEHEGVPGRLADMMSKLEMWSETQYSEIAYLDSDAFPVANIDDIFAMAPAQRCIKNLLPAEDEAVEDEICNYKFAAYPELGDQINAGVIVFSPNTKMHMRLARESLNQSQFDNGFMEQALLNLAYHHEGPFPPSYLPHTYNGGPDMWNKGEDAHVVHTKLWAQIGEIDTTWFKHTFNYTWLDMKDLYESAEFEELRATGTQPSDTSSYCCRDLKPEFSHTVLPPIPTDWI